MSLLLVCHCKIIPYRKTQQFKKKQSKIKRKKTPEDLNRKEMHLQSDDEKTL